MKALQRLAVATLPALAIALWPAPAAAQNPVPVVAPIIVDTAVPIIVSAVKPKPTGLAKFEGFVVNANIAQITVRSKGNDLGIRTFPLSEKASAKMQQIIDRGGYQYGDKVTVLYDAGSLKAMQVKGKPSRPL